eukprot:283008_1
MPDSLCWHTGLIVRTLVFSCINIILILSTIPIIYQFIKNHIESTNKVSMKLFYSTLMFLIVTVAVLSSQLYLLIIDCSESISKFIGEIVHVSLYLMQNYLVLSIAFTKLYIVFNNTIFQLAKSTVQIYGTLYIIMPILCVIGGVCYGIDTQLGTIVGAVLFLFLLFFIIATFILFIRKLMAVYRK